MNGVTQTGLQINFYSAPVPLPEESAPVPGIVLELEGCGFNLTLADARRLAVGLAALLVAANGGRPR